MKTTLYKLQLAAVLLLTAIALVGCGEDDDDVENPDATNDQEVITTLNMTFTPMDGSAAVTAQFRDADGDGGEAPTKTDNIALANGVTYTLDIELLNETVPETDEEYQIDNEIKEEAEEHQFFFTGTAIGSVLTHAYADMESTYATNNGDDLPVGISNTITATAAGDGTFIVTLKHQPPVNGMDVKTATSGISDGETDIEVEFNVTVQ
ncbi:MAG: hypothetical protein AAFX99_04595 [Myxococcota bacterium]